ncbi:MAG TPA: pitrilysin family protein [Patescibacteria group bacterium]|nr:pitrilysin family protein [Patescibacteria group bacterium]
MHKLTVLNNKIQLITAPLHETKAVTVLVLVKVGSRYEPAKISGISHFIEHLLFKGTKKRPTSLDITRELDGIGAEYNAFTSKHHTGYYIKASHKHLELALDMLSDMLFNSVFDKKELERERGVIIEEINMYDDNPLISIGDVYESVVFAGHALGRKISGKKANVSSITRREILDFYRRYYLTGRLVVGVAGNFNQQRAVTLVNKYFGRPESRGAGRQFAKFSRKQTSPRAVSVFKPTQQVQLALGFPAISLKSPQVYPLTVLSTILGGSMSSRLFTEIREKRGLCYSIRTSLSLFEDTGTFLVQAGLDTSRLTEAVGAIKDELVKITADKVSAAELKRAKEFIKGNLILRLEDSADLIVWLAEQKMLSDKVETLEQKIAKLDAVSIKDLGQLAKQLIDFKRLNLAIIGPVKDKNKFIKIFK